MGNKVSYEELIHAAQERFRAFVLKPFREDQGLKCLVIPKSVVDPVHPCSCFLKVPAMGCDIGQVEYVFDRDYVVKEGGEGTIFCHVDCGETILDSRDPYGFNVE